MCGVLIVDDDASIRFAMADYFAAKGYRAATAQSLAEVEACFAHDHYGVVITDLRLTPLGDNEGLAIVRLVSQRYHDTACIVLTAYGGADSEATARSHGARDFLHKPRPMSELLAIVARLLPPGSTCPRRGDLARPAVQAGLALLLGMALAAAPAQAQESTGPAGERRWSFDIGGRIQLDHDTFDGVYSNEGDRVSETYLRRARIELSARTGKHWRFGLDIAPLENGAGTLDTLIVAYRGLGPIDVSVGRFKPDFSLEEATSSKWVTGIERSAIWDLAPDAADRGGSWGVDLRTHGKHHHASVGFYRKPDHKAQALRVVVAPMLAPERVLHLGVSLSREAIESGDGRIRSRLGVRGVTESDRGNRVTLARSKDAAFDGDAAAVFEFAYAQGPISVQSEFLQRRLSGIGEQPRRTARGHYVQVAYTLTGEARPYQIDGAKFEEIRPAGKSGAWETFYRHDRLAVKGEAGLLSRRRSTAESRVHVLGLNWYATRSVKLSVNHLWGSTGDIDNDAGDTRGRGLSLRLQMLF